MINQTIEQKLNHAILYIRDAKKHLKAKKIKHIVNEDMQNSINSAITKLQEIR